MAKPSFDQEQRLLALVNNIEEVERLVEFIDPRGKNKFSKAVAENIFVSKNTQPDKQFTHIDQLRELFRDKEQFDRFVKEAEYTPDTTYPVLLLPLRLETRFTSEHLLVRIYPDQFSIHSHEESLTQAEYEAGKKFKESTEGGKKDKWRALSLKHGPTRAAWIAKLSDSPNFETDNIDRTESNFQMPKLSALPDKYWVFAYRGDAVVHAVTSNPVRTDSTIIGPLDGKRESLFDDNSKWMHDFETAVNDGFAVKINLTSMGFEGFDRIIAVGMKRARPSQSAETIGKLLDAHHYTGGLGFITPGSPTNNTNKAKSSYTSRADYEASYEIEREEPTNWKELSKGKPRTNAHLLAEALGIDSNRLKFIEGAGSVSDSGSEDMNTVLWTVTGDYYLRYLLPDLLDEEQLKYLRSHVKKFVRGGGPLPTLRVGRQPYGVLPVTRIMRGKSEWLPWSGDSDASEWDRHLHFVISKFYQRWLSFAQNSQRVPRVGIPDEDPDETLLRILSMEPNSVTYRARPFVDKGFIAWLLAILRDYAFGSGTAYGDTGLTPLQWMSKWAESWDSIQKRNADLLSKLSKKDTDEFLGSPDAGTLAKPLMTMLGWGEGEDKPIEMIKELSEASPSPSQYLAQICKSSSTSSLTLLAKMFERALPLAGKQSDQFRDEIKEAICRLSSTNALHFFNTVTTPEQIVKHIKDDPLHHPERKGYGIRHKLASRILSKREELGGQFKSLQEIDDIFRVGSDTMHDILYSFKDDKGQTDIDRVFRESLDLASHRVDAWVTSFATKRLKGIREQEETKKGIHIGAYGFVEDLVPRAEDKLSEGYFHTPSSPHAATAAVLYNAFLTHNPQKTRENSADTRTENPFHINLTSERVRHALRMLEGIRKGQPLGALIGYKFERALRDHVEPLEQYIHDLREKFPLVAHKVTSSVAGESAEAVAARNVVDGLALIRDFNGEEGTEGHVEELLDSLGNHKIILRDVITETSDTLDALSDTLLTESVYQAVQGNYEKSGAALEAASGNLPPPEIESVKTPVSGRTVNHRIGMLFNGKLDPLAEEQGPPPDLTHPRVAAEPNIAVWFDSILKPMSNIGVTFEFWEEETDPGRLRLVNVNTAPFEVLKAVPVFGDALAQKIIEERSTPRGLFKQISDLKRVTGIGDAKIADVKLKVTTGYAERVNLNTASVGELEALFSRVNVSGIADEINRTRNVQSFTCIDDLTNVAGIDVTKVEQLRPFVTTGMAELSLDLLRLKAAEFLYLAQVPADGDETEIEQRLGRIVRDEFALPLSQTIVIHSKKSGNYKNSLANAIELARHVLDLLASGTPMSFDTMCHPGEIKGGGYHDDDVTKLLTRVNNVKDWVSTLKTQFDNVNIHCSAQLQIEVNRKITQELVIKAGLALKHTPTGTNWITDSDIAISTGKTWRGIVTISRHGLPIIIPPSSDWDIEASNLSGISPVSIPVDSVLIKTIDNSRINSFEPILPFLEKAARLGIVGAFSPAQDDPHLLDRYKNTREELHQRCKACKKLITEVEAIKKNNGKIEKLLKAMKALLGKSFITLPTFVPHRKNESPNTLNSAFSQYVDSVGDDRLRLWMQQVASVKGPVAKLEDILMMTEAWSSTDSHLSLKVAQLPHTPNRNWLGLSTEEGSDESRPEEGWARSPLSLVLTMQGDLPDFADTSTVVSGILLDDWDELIPSKQVNTSVAYQYDAPNAQAPQAILLALSGRIKVTPDPWTPEALAAIVADTADLAKVRAVDIDALAEDSDKSEEDPTQPFGGIMPGIFLPTDISTPGWAGDGVSKSIRQWIETLEETPHRCITGRLDWPRLIDDNEQEWTLIPHSNFDVNRFAPGLDHPTLKTARVEIKANVGEMTKRVFYRDYRVLEYPTSFEPIQVTGKASWQGNPETSSLRFRHNGSKYNILGSLRIEVGRLPYSTKQIPSIFGRNNHEVILDVYITITGCKGPGANDPIWVDSYSAEAEGNGYFDLNGETRSLRINTPVLIGEVEQGIEGIVGPGGYLTGDYVINTMRSFFASRIWVVGRFKVVGNSGVTGDSGILIGTGVNTSTSASGPTVDVTDFGLIREKHAVFGCEG